jgi:protocatechuate 3,4-dioxygenase beta subunit
VFEKFMMCWLLAPAAVLQLSAQQKSQGVTAPASLAISGTLVDANTGQPLQRARVALAPVTQRDNLITITTREDGRFLFTNLAPGKYSLTAQARGYLAQSFNQHEQYSSSIAVGPNLDSSDLLFRLPPEGAISGVVVDEAGEPVRDAEVVLYFAGATGGVQTTRARGRITTDDQGVYQFGHLLPGRYLVAVVTRPWYAQSQQRAGNSNPADTIVAGADLQGDARLDVVYPVTFNGGVTDAGEASPLVLGRGEKLTVDINLQPVSALHVRMPRDDSEPAGYTSMELRLFDLSLGGRVRGFFQNGDEVVSVPPGHYALRHFPPNGGGPAEPFREVDVSTSGDIDKSQGNVNVPVSATLKLEPGTNAGVLTLQLLNKKSRQVIGERVDSNGEAVIKQGVAPGTYEVSVVSSTGMYLKSLSATGAAVTGRTVEIAPGNGVKLAISATLGQAQVKGTVLRDNKPSAGAMIVLVPADPAHNQVLFRRDQSDSDGSFTLAAIVPGAYTLLAIENGWDLEWMKAEVLKSYLGAGVALQVEANGKYDVKVPVQ